MTINYTTLLGLAEPVTGTESGVWGDDVNKGITEYLDIAIAGTQTISGSQTAVTLSLTNGSSAGNNIAQAGTGTTGTAQYATINCTGNPAGTLTITVPASSRRYIVINATSTNQSVKIVGVGPTTGITIPAGQTAQVVWNGSDFVDAANYVNSNFRVNGSVTSTSVVSPTIGAASSASLALQSNGTTNATLDTSGNLGLGVTPSAWGGTQKAFQVRQAVMWNYNNLENAYVGSNYYFDGTNRKYIITGYATEYSQGSGAHAWFTAASGSAGSTVSFTQAMTLDASGNLGVGTTSPSSYSKFAVINTDYSFGTFGTTNGTAVTVNIGSNSVTQGGYVNTVTNHPLIFGTNSTERARIDSSGNLLVGTTSSAGSTSNTAKVVGGQFKSVAGTASSSSTPTTMFTMSTVGTYYVSVLYAASNAAAFDAFAIIVYDGSSQRIVLQSNGTQVLITLSGTNVQVTNLFNSSTVNWSYMLQSIN